MEKLILENRSDLPMSKFLELVQEIIEEGRISNNNKQYCYLSVYKINGKEYHIASELNKKSDKLILYNNDK
jgi:hypothetical protein